MDDGGGSLITYDVPEIQFGFPAWSPDGSRIAVVGTGPDDTAVYVFDVPREQPTGPAHPAVIYRSAQTPPFYVYWLPSGLGVGMLASEDTGISLRFVPADGSLPLDGSGPGIIRQGSPLYFSWTGADSALVHVGLGLQSKTAEAAVNDPAAVSDFPARPGTGTFRTPAISSDGRYVAFVKAGTNGLDQLVIQTRGGRAVQQTTVTGPTAFGFDAVDDRLAWISSGKPVDANKFYPVGPLKLMDTTYGKVRTLIDEPVVAFFWSPDGQTIAAILPAQPGDDLLTTASTGSLTADTPGAPLRIEFIDVKTGRPRGERVVRLAPYFVNALIPYFDQYALSHDLWSLDSASIVLPLVDATGRDQIVVVPADGSDPHAHRRWRQGLLEPLTACYHHRSSVRAAPIRDGDPEERVR